MVCNLRILIVDANQVRAAIIEEGLREAGYHELGSRFQCRPSRENLAPARWRRSPAPANETFCPGEQ